ncbi:RING-H2 finger protein ATL56 [Quillaja saponaria]|uniref:RING-H2 finger protein ATL56 n=1 Tax=Quillaja saponaria TaxID=32244 RepID=A0AAD7PI29_QUISA|nr:RING-H2 finger protein ATL56 [Quillaja saponaria]KAJ7955724.1 RING-H2 finger protein ATL56 [Quillaja saponaria]
MPPPPSPYHHATTGPQSQIQTPPPKQNHKLLSFLLKAIIMTFITSLFFIFLGFAALILLHLCLAGAVLHHPRFRRSTQLQATSSNGLSPHDVKKLSQFRLAKGNEPESDFQCVVCLDGLRNGQWCRELSVCGHVFHRRCVDTWLIKMAACPICRTPVSLNVGTVDSPSGPKEEEAKQLWAFW